MAAEIVVVAPNRAVACAGSRSAAAYVAKNAGNTAVITVVKYAELAQSYQPQACCSGVRRPARVRTRAITRGPGAGAGAEGSSSLLEPKSTSKLLDQRSLALQDLEPSLCNLEPLCAVDFGEVLRTT